METNDTFSFFKLTSSEKESIREETRNELRKEFINIYYRNEEYYNLYITHLNKIIEEKNDIISHRDNTIKQLVNLLATK
jgi:hypothetical protein